MRLYCTLLVTLLAASTASAQTAAPVAPATGQASFTILAGGRPIGRQQVTVSQDASGWIITSTGRLDPPVDLTISRFEMKYSPDWQPLELKIDAIDRRTSIALATSFAMTTAINEITREGRTASKEDQITARTIVVPNNFYGSYEALAARLSAVTAGAELPLYIAPTGEVKATVRNVTSETLRGPASDTQVRRFDLLVPNGQSQIDMSVTVDARSRLVRLEIPSAGLSVVRDDLSGVSTRVVTERNPTDADVTIPANGFVLAGTLTAPPGVAGRLRYPAVILVSGPGSGRDALAGDVPLFTQLAGALANSGHLVLRYDNRGIAQSGGRTESATLADYADDLVAAVKWMAKRHDVDDRRVVVCGYAQGAAIALLAAAREKEVDALVTIASPGGTGADVLLEQQRQVLAGMNIPEAEKQAKIELQKRIQQAVMSGSGWEGVPDNLRRQADTPLFRSQLSFDPAEVLKKTRQPMFIVQGDADAQVTPASAEQLASLARGRKKAGGVEVLHVPGMTHALAEGSERAVSPKIASAIADWIKKTL